MALQLQTSLSSGVSANYFKITQLRFDALTSHLTIDASLYLSQEARQSGAEAIKTNRFGVACPLSFQQGYDDILAAAYAKLKLLPEFAGSTDV